MVEQHISKISANRKYNLFGDIQPVYLIVPPKKKVLVFEQLMVTHKNGISFCLANGFRATKEPLLFYSTQLYLSAIMKVLPNPKYYVHIVCDPTKALLFMQHKPVV